MDFGTAIRTCLRKYAVFGGRARRSEYWYFALFCFLVNLAMMIVQGVVRAVTDLYLPLDTIVWLALLLPQIAAQVRRVHDTDRSGWLVAVFYIVCVAALLVGVPLLLSPAREGAISVIVFLLPVLGIVGYGIFLLVVTVLDGTRGTNRYGTDPKAPPVDVF